MRLSLGNIWFALCILLLVAQGCTDDSYTGIYDPTLRVNDPIAVVIRFADQKFATKTYDGKGVVEDLYRIKDDTLYVSAVMNEGNVSYAEDRDFLLYNRRATVNVQDRKLDWVLRDGDTPVYYPWKDRAYESYNMFAWYLDNAEFTGEDRYEDRVNWHLTIDGTQDVMGSKAYALTSEPGFEERVNSFSYYTAVRNIVPSVTPQHLLSCLSIRFKPAISDIRQTVVINSVRLQSYNHIVMSTVSRDDNWLRVSTEGEQAWFGGNLIREGADPVVLESIPGMKDPKPVYVGDVIIPPTAATSTKIYVDAIQTIYTKEGGRYVYHIEPILEIKHPDGLHQGINYAATLTVNGTIYMGYDVTVVDWGEGGSILVDQDQNPEFN